MPFKRSAFSFKAGRTEWRKFPFMVGPSFYFISSELTFSLFRIESLHHSSYHARRRKDTCASRLQACNRKLAFSIQTVAKSLSGYAGWLVSKGHFIFLVESILFRRPVI